jgi:hypothetical protein
VELEFNKIITGYFCSPSFTVTKTKTITKTKTKTKRQSIPKPKLIVKIKINETEIIKKTLFQFNYVMVKEQLISLMLI